MGFFKKRYGPEDFYGHAAKALNVPLSKVPQIATVRHMEREWNAEFNAYGMTAEEYVQAWLTFPEFGPLAEAWKAQMALFEEASYMTFQTILTKLLERRNGLPVASSAPPTFVITAWRSAGCPDPGEWVKTNAALFGPWS